VARPLALGSGVRDGIVERRPSILTMRVIVVVLAVGVAAGLLSCKGSSAGTADSGPPDTFAPQPKPTSSTPANASPLPAASVQAYVNRDHLPPYQGPTGSVEGTITVTGDPSPETKSRDFTKCPQAKEAFKHLFREGAARPDGSRLLPDALVAVTGYSGAYLPEQKEARLLTIDDCVPSSRTIDMTIGQKLQVQNLMKDKIFAPAFVQEPSMLALIAPPGEDPVNLYPHAPGVLTLFDRFGAGSGYLSAEVYVLVQPLHGVSDLKGHYRIDGIPVGDMKVNALLGVVQKEASKPVTIRPNVVETVDLQLEYKAPTLPDLGHARPAGDAGRPTILK
jgi:hypothetical protein